MAGVNILFTSNFTLCLFQSLLLCCYTVRTPWCGASPSCLLASAQVGSLHCRVMTAAITFSTSGGGRPYDLISVMSFLFRDSRAFIGGEIRSVQTELWRVREGKSYLHGLLQGWKSFIQVPLSILRHGFTLQLLGCDLLTVGTNCLRTHANTYALVKATPVETERALEGSAAGSSSSPSAACQPPSFAAG